MATPRPIPGEYMKTTSSIADAKILDRKLRNRLSQRAFRARQSVYIKELEEKLKWASKPDYDINTRLEEENKKLRSQLLDCQKKLDSLIVSMELVSKSLTKATNIEVSEPSSF
jgi:hypothetical protein